MRFVRMENGVPVAWIFEVDPRTMMIMQEYRHHGQNGGPVLEPGEGETPAERTLRRMRVQARRNPGGGIDILRSSPLADTVNTFFDMNKPCPPGLADCAKLRQSYAADLDRLPKNDEGQCRGCDAAAVKQRYSEHILNMMGVPQ